MNLTHFLSWSESDQTNQCPPGEKEAGQQPGFSCDRKQEATVDVSVDAAVISLITAGEHFLSRKERTIRHLIDSGDTVGVTGALTRV